MSPRLSPSIRVCVCVSLSCLQGGPPRSFVHRLLQISSWRAHDGAIQTMTVRVGVCDRLCCVVFCRVNVYFAIDLQMIDSDSMEEMVLATSGTDLRVRLWNLAGVHLGSLLHGPHVVCVVSVLCVCVCNERPCHCVCVRVPSLLVAVCWMHCLLSHAPPRSPLVLAVAPHSLMTSFDEANPGLVMCPLLFPLTATWSSSAHTHTFRADPECKLLNGTHPGLDEVNTTADTSLSIAWSNGRGHPTAIRQVVR